MRRTVLASLFITVACLLGVATGTVLSNAASAATAENCAKESKTFLAFPTWYKYLDPQFDGATGECKINVAFDNIPQTIPKILLAVIEIMLRIGAIVAIVFVVVGGVRLVTSQGQPEATASARKTIINALLGLVIAVSATALVVFIGGRFT